MARAYREPDMDVNRQFRAARRIVALTTMFIEPLDSRALLSTLAPIICLPDIAPSDQCGDT
jgi:hypothetical protein